MMFCPFEFHDADIGGRDHGCICMSKCVTVGHTIGCSLCGSVFRMDMCMAADALMNCI